MFSKEVLKKCREDLGMSQERLMIEMANNGAKVSRPTLSNWESGSSLPDANELATLAIVFKKPVKSFFASRMN